MKRPSDLVALIVAVGVVGCSTGGGTSGGCTSLAPIPGGQYTGQKTDNAVNLQLSPEGVNYVNQNWQQLTSMFAPGNVLHIPVACSKQNISPLGDVYIADQGNVPGSSTLDGRCDPGEGADVAITLTGLQITPGQPDQLDVVLTAEIDTGKIYMLNPNFLCDLRCSIDFNSAFNPPPDNRFAVTIKFAIDTKWDKLLSFSIPTVNGTQVCGSSGAPPKPTCFDASDLNLKKETGFCSFVCDAVDWDPVKTFVLQLVSPMLQDKIKSMIGNQTCRQCGAMMPPCPSAGGQASSCSDGVCMDTQTNKCVPRFLGVEGRVNLGATMGSFGVPAEAALDLSIGAGSSFSIDAVNAINIGTRGGLAAVSVAPCVAQVPAPALPQLAPPDFRAEAPPVTMTNPPYHMALGVSAPFLNLAFHQAQQGGVLCLQLSSATVGLLNSGLFKTFLPSLGKLATRDGKDAPMMIVLRPASPPDVKIGPGGMKPLITVALKDLTIDFYASIDDRFARLFSLTADITLPLSLTFSGCTAVTPGIGDVKMLITNIRTANAEMLAEDPKVLADLIPAVVGLAEPALASALKPIDLPDLGAFKLKVNAGKGVGNIAGTETYNHLGLYATMLPLTAACATVAPRVTASLKQSLIPRADQMRARGSGLTWPTAVLGVTALGVPGTPEYQTRIDDGLWGEFRSANASGELWVSHPVFLIQGAHKIEVRGRVAEDPHGIGEPVTVPFLVDWDPPEVRLALDRAHDRLQQRAHDVISPDGRLEYSYQVGDGEWSAYGPAREIIVSLIEDRGGVTVRVRDEQGNVGQAAWRVPIVAVRPDAAAAAATADEGAAGCAAAPALPLALLALLGLRRRRR